MSEPSQRWLNFLSGRDAEIQYRLLERCAIHEFDGGLSRTEAEERTMAEEKDQMPEFELKL